MSVRTIFLMVRGIDQTGRMFTSLETKINRVIAQQITLNKTFADVHKTSTAVLQGMAKWDNMAYRMIFAGAAFTAFAGMMAYGFLKIIEKSTMGALVVGDFETAMDKMMASISETVTQVWGPAISDFLSWLDDLSKDETFKMIIGGIGPAVAITLSVIGVILLVGGMLGKFLGALLSLLITAGYFDAGIVPTLSYVGANAVIYAAVGMLVAFAVWDITGSVEAAAIVGAAITGALILAKVLPLIFTSSYTAQVISAGLGITIPVVLTFLLVAVLWEHAKEIQQAMYEVIAGLSPEEAKKQAELSEEWRQWGSVMGLPRPKSPFEIWLEKLLGTYGGELPDIDVKRGQTGHTAIAKTGLMLVHEGEMLFNPQLPITPPSQLLGRRGISPTHISVTQYIDHIHTEADETRLAKKTAEYIADEVQKRGG